MVLAVLDRELDARDLQKLNKSIAEINAQMESCKNILGLDEF
jgi:hypothetical protein